MHEQKYELIQIYTNICIHFCMNIHTHYHSKLSLYKLTHPNNYFTYFYVQLFAALLLHRHRL